MRKNGLSVKLSASVLAFLLAFPLQTIWAATGEATTKVKHKPPKESYVPGFRIELKAEMEDKIGFLTTRCYFKAKDDSAFTFVNMFPAGGDNLKCILPAPWVNSEYIEYLFVAVNRNKKVTRTQMFKIEEAETKEAANWKEAGEVKEIRVDQAQDIVEEYEGLRKELRSRYSDKRADYQIDAQDGMTLSTELDPAMVSFNGFYDSVTATLVPASARYGLSVEGLYTAEQVAMAGGSAAVAETGAASTGTVIASSGMSGAAVLGTGLLAAAVIGGGAAAAVALSDDDDDDEKEPKINASARVRWGDAGAEAVVADDAFDLWFAGRHLGRSPMGQVGEATVSGLEVGVHELRIQFSAGGGQGSFSIDLFGGARFGDGSTHKEGLIQNLNGIRTFTVNVPAP